MICCKMSYSVYTITKLNTLSPKNIQRKLKRREEKIDELSHENINLKKKLLEEQKLQDSLTYTLKQKDELIENLNKELDDALRSKTKSQKLKWYYKNVLDSQKHKDEIVSTSFDSQIMELKNQILVLEHQKTECEERLQEFFNSSLNLKINGRYNDNVRAVYQDLVCMGVGINNVKPIVETVLKNIANFDVECLPSSTFARLMFLEARRIAQIQVAESLVYNYDNQCHTLYSDGTSKFGQHYGTSSNVSI